MPAKNATATKASKSTAGTARRRSSPSLHPPSVDLGPIFRAAKFRETTTENSRSTGCRDFEGKTIGRWILRASCYPELNEYIAYVVLSRARGGGGFTYGTSHAFATVEALERELPDAVDHLTRLAKNDDVLKCGVCKRRYLIVRGGYLCCEAMKHVPYWVDETKKNVACRGRSTRIPAQIVHPERPPKSPNDAVERFVQVWLPLAQSRAGRKFRSDEHATRFFLEAWRRFRDGASANAFGMEWT